MQSRTQRVWPAAPWVWAVLCLGGFAASPVQAARVTSVSPQGEVASVDQVVVKFDEAMVPVGDPRAQAPAAVKCTDTSLAGEGHWLEPKIWVYDFKSSLPPGAKCSVELRGGLSAVSGAALSGTTRYAFNTGGPAVTSIRPSYGPIDENQIFILTLNGAAQPASVIQHAWCETEGVGERIGVKGIEGGTRLALLKRFSLEKQAARVVMLQCNRTLAAGAKMHLVWGAGITTPSGVPTKQARRFEYDVREPFTASFSCERENANAPCTPLRPLRLTFNSPVARDMAAKIRLHGAGAERSPTFSDSDRTSSVSDVTFNAPFPEKAELTISLPKGFTDDSGRALDNAGEFPLKTKTATMPPLAKFAAAPFGIVERFAEPGMPPMLPVTLRKVEPALQINGLGVAGEAAKTGGGGESGRTLQLRVDDDAEVMNWMSRVRRFDETTMTRKQIAQAMPSILTAPAANVAFGPNAAVIVEDKITRYDTRSLSLLSGWPGVQALTLPVPKEKDPRPFEVVGIPFQKPGFYVVELASPSLGAALLGKSLPMYVRTTVLVTNLGVHFKMGRENAIAWVTTLDKGQPVANAKVRVLDCDGSEVASAVTDKTGVAKIDKSLERYRYCEKTMRSGYFVVARTQGNDPDMAFVSSDWDRGIEPWRFHVPTDGGSSPTVRAQTVFDRVLFRVGETVSMKHFIRQETMQGLVLPASLPSQLTITHEGSGQTYTQPIKWRNGRLAENTFQIPQGAKLGEYAVTLDYTEADSRPKSYPSSLDAGHFRVEAFRLPVLAGSIGVRDAAKSPLINKTEAPVNVQVNYVAGGPAGNLPVRVSALLRVRDMTFDGYDDFSFTPYRPPSAQSGADDGDQGNDESAGASDQKLVADKQRLVLDRNGAGNLTLKDLPKVDRPSDLVLEASFADPNGEIQTLRGNATLWPANLITGVRSESWVSVTHKLPVKALALDLQGKPKAGVAMDARD